MHYTLNINNINYNYQCPEQSHSYNAIVNVNGAIFKEYVESCHNINFTVYTCLLIHYLHIYYLPIH